MSYRGLFKMTFKGELQYRAKALSGVVTQFFWGVMYVYLYTAFMTGKIIDGFTISQMASYIWLGQAFFAFRYIDLPKGCGEEIKNGNVCYKFVRPLNLYNQWYVEHLGYKLSATLLRFAPIMIIALLLPSNIGLMLPTSFLAFLLFILALMLGALMTSAISMLAVGLTFRTLSPKGTSTMVNVITTILAGGYIPLPLMPKAMQNILSYLPFRFISDLPYRIYIGNIGLLSGLKFLAVGVAWLIVLILLGKLLIVKSTKKTVIQGG